MYLLILIKIISKNIDRAFQVVECELSKALEKS